MEDIKMWACMKAWNVLWRWWPDREFVIHERSLFSHKGKVYTRTSNRASAEKYADIIATDGENSINVFDVTEYLDHGGRKVKPKEPQ